MDGQLTFTGVTVLDGSGEEPFVGDVVVRGDRIERSGAPDDWA